MSSQGTRNREYLKGTLLDVPENLLHPHTMSFRG
jgi:hypothetical protein